MSITSIRTDFIILFILGVLGVVLGICLIFYQLFDKGYIFNFSASDPYGIFVGWSAVGVASLVAGVIVVCCTYQIFIPLKKSVSTTAGICPYCGANLKEDAPICEKCKQQVDPSEIGD